MVRLRRSGPFMVRPSKFHSRSCQESQFRPGIGREQRTGRSFFGPSSKAHEAGVVGVLVELPCGGRRRAHPIGVGYAASWVVDAVLSISSFYGPIALLEERKGLVFQAGKSMRRTVHGFIAQGGRHLPSKCAENCRPAPCRSCSDRLTELLLLAGEPENNARTWSSTISIGGSPG